MSELRCQKPKDDGTICGGVLRGPTAGMPSKSAGRVYAVCVVCRRRTLTPIRPPWPYRVKRYSGEPVAEAHPAGSTVCGRHTIEPAELEPRFEHLRGRCDFRIIPGVGTFGYFSEPITVDGVRCDKMRPEGWSIEADWMKRGASPEGFGRCILRRMPGARPTAVRPDQDLRRTTRRRERTRPA